MVKNHMMRRKIQRESEKAQCAVFVETEKKDTEKKLKATLSFESGVRKVSTSKNTQRWLVGTVIDREEGIP